MLARAAAVLVLSLPVVLGGCGSKGAVSLIAHIQRPELSARANSLDLLVPTGGFDIVLELGEAAERATTVSFGSIGLESEMGAALVDRLDTSCEPAFPVTLAAGDSATVHCVLAASQVIDPEEGDICDGALRYVGVVTDTLNDGRPTRLISDAFSATCE